MTPKDWKEVCKALIGDFPNMTDSEKIKFLQTIILKLVQEKLDAGHRS